MQCDIGMLCAVENVTKTTTLVTSKTFMTSSMLNNTNNYKMCLCDKELGYMEDKHDPGHCNGAIALILSGTLVPLLTVLVGSTIARKPLNDWATGF